MNQSTLRLRSSDKPWQWAVLFTLFSVATVPFYCFTRKTWKPFVYVFASISSALVLWALIIGIIEGFTVGNYQEAPIAESLLYIGCIAAIYGGGYYSVHSLRKSAVATIRGSASSDDRDIALSPTSEADLTGSTDSVSPRQAALTSSQRFAVLISSIIVLLIGGYAVHTTTVEATIKANPVLSAVAKTGTEVKIKHFDCGDIYGYYDSSIDTLQICTAVHDDQLISSKESTIRHEAWHLVQACSAVKSKDDEWGRFDLVSSPLLATKSLTADENRYISENYEERQRSVESEALLAESHLTDGQIIQAIKEKCYFPE
ncbi:hypothetical protein VB734_08450 [Synechococcus sp. BA-124 BA4]|uniref:hypothetical protein n=1 Tax=unclassified Synechococcus TaxID=2626047 RepID=UPI002AD4EF41|nr:MULTISPECIES: hypothetical protein [unclassified Synechococcus]MEA5400067.1 hypothetical protein [Synechococcus sp. BA-124 BA4]